MQICKNIVGLDFETYFDVQYSLKKMSITEYVRDPRFKAQCVGIRTNRQKKARWYGPDEIKDVLHSFDWSNTALLAHNAQFDGFILSQKYDIKPAFNYCTMSMARGWIGDRTGVGLDEVAKYYGLEGKVRADALAKTKGIVDLPPELLNPLGEYCKDDVDDMFEVFKILRNEYNEDELRLIDLTIKMFTDPVLLVDEKRVKTELLRQKMASEATIKAGGVDIKVLNSDQKLATEFVERGLDVPMKWSEKQKKTVPDFAKSSLAFQDLCKHPQDNIRQLALARLEAKSTSDKKRLERLLLHSKPTLPMYLNYSGAHTHRWSGGDKMNPQNLKRGSETRRSIIAPRGQMIVVIDSGQIEARVCAWLAGQENLLEAFRNKTDVYKLMASDIYSVPIEEVDKDQRFIGKMAVLGLGFQMGAPKFQSSLEAGVNGPPAFITMQEASKVVNVYRSKNSEIVRLWSRMQGFLMAMYTGSELSYKCIAADPEKIWLPNSMHLDYPDLNGKWDPYREQMTDFTYRTRRGRTKVYGGLLTENVVQALARIIVADQMLRIAEKYRVVTMSHDEVVYLAPEKEAEKAYEFGYEQMLIPPDWCSDIPLAAEGGFAKNYSK